MKKMNIGECADELSRVRGSALCGICSGKSHQYFLGGKGLVSTPVCLRLYDKCDSQVSVATVFFTLLLGDLKPVQQAARS